jgi:hypothetical protein
MGRFFDIFFMPEGVAITLFQFFQVAVMYLTTNHMNYQNETYESKALDLSITIWKFGIHLHLVLAERNICQDVQLAKS